jgi:hypothetical protein
MTVIFYENPFNLLDLRAFPGTFERFSQSISRFVPPLLRKKTINSHDLFKLLHSTTSHPELEEEAISAPCLYKFAPS